jgi:23S rRNA pseudouridine2605 synthase
LNKPPGYLCTNYDPGGRRRVLDLLPPGGPRLFTVGRLDENSTGLLIVTNDGDFAEQLAHPRHQIFRTYHVQVAGHPKREVYEQLKQGMFFTEGKFRVLGIKSLKKVGQSAWLEVVLSEGQNRELRRLFARVGHKVLKLARVSFGALKLGKLKMGEFRDLTTREIATLRELVDRVGSGKRRGPAKGRGPKKKPGSRPGRGRPESKGPRSEGGRSGKSGLGRSGRPGSKRPRR